MEITSGEQDQDMEITALHYNACQLMDLNGTSTPSTEPAYTIHFTYVYRVIYAVGLSGNLFSLLVWTRSGLRSTPVTYFRAICVADSLVLIMHPLESLHDVHVPGVCQLVHVLFLAVETFAIFLVLGLSVQRYLELCHPLTAGHLITHTRTVRLVLLLAALSLLFSLCEAYIWHVDCGTCQPRASVAASPSFMWTYAMVVLVLVFLCPLLAVVVFNILLVTKIHRKRKNSAAFSVSMVPDKHTMNVSVTFVSLYLAVCELLYGAVHISQYYFVLVSHDKAAAHSPHGGHATATGAKSDVPLTGRWHSYHMDSLPLLILDVIALTAYAVDVTIFTLCSKTFRTSVRGLFHRFKRQKSSISLRSFRQPTFTL